MKYLGFNDAYIAGSQSMLRNEKYAPSWTLCAAG